MIPTSFVLSFAISNKCSIIFYEHAVEMRQRHLSLLENISGENSLRGFGISSADEISRFIKITGNSTKGINILEQWIKQAEQFLGLSKYAKNALACQTTCVASGSVFSL